jgi:hypothetical protein
MVAGRPSMEIAAKGRDSVAKTVEGTDRAEMAWAAAKVACVRSFAKMQPLGRGFAQSGCSSGTFSWLRSGLADAFRRCAGTSVFGA